MSSICLAMTAVSFGRGGVGKARPAGEWRGGGPCQQQAPGHLGHGELPSWFAVGRSMPHAGRMPRQSRAPIRRGPSTTPPGFARDGAANERDGSRRSDGCAAAPWRGRGRRCRRPSPAGRRASSPSPMGLARRACDAARPGRRAWARSTVSSLRFSTTMRPPIITECTAVPSSVWTMLVHRIVDRDPVDVVQVEEDDVGLVARRDPADLLVAGRARGRCLRWRPAAPPRCVSQRCQSGPCTFEASEASRIASYMFWLSEQLAPSVPMPTLTLRVRACRARRPGRCPAACWSRDCAPPRRRGRPAASCRRRRATRRAPR